MWLFPLQLVGIHVGVEGLQIHGRGEEIALSVLAVRGKELLQLVFGLHALAEDLDAEAAAMSTSEEMMIQTERCFSCPGARKARSSLMVSKPKECSMAMEE